MNNRFRKGMYILVVCISAIIFAFSVMYLFYNIYPDIKEKQLVNEIQTKKEQKTDNNQQVQILEENEDLNEENNNLYNRIEADNDQQRQILEEYKDLYEENNDLYGWIEIDGTTINYPVMFTPDNPNYYTDKNWNKEICPNGVGTSIYISGETTQNSENIIIYGHHMKNLRMLGMFRDLKLYRDEEEYYESHKYIKFDTLYEKQVYEIISVSKDIVYYDEEQIPDGKYLFYNHIELDTKQEFEDYITYIKDNAWYEIETTAEFGDQLITLCTCDYWTENARLLIVAKKI